MSSTVIDNKIVEIELQNRNFESNARTTIDTLGKLQQALDFSSSSKSFENINRDLNSLEFDKVAKSVDNISEKFSLLGMIGFSALNNITNKLVDTGLAISKNLVIGQKNAGFAEYELKMGSIRTIMEGSGESMETVKDKLEELNQYADKTIYSFSDMTRNIGKFTNAGVKLDEAVSAIKGVSNLAALTGQGAAQAERAMYNIAQALSSGVTRLQDWRSIENANMSSVEFRDLLIKIGVEQGNLIKQGDKYVTNTAKGIGKLTDAATGGFDAVHAFNYSLSSGWLTNDIMIKGLNVLSGDIKEVGGEFTDIGERATAAATEIRTFSILMDTLKEESGSGWAKTWELIFGDLKQSTELWTALGTSIQGALKKISDSRNDVLDYWNKFGGRGSVIAGIKNIFTTITAYTKPISEAWKRVFPPWPKSWLNDISIKFEMLTTKLKENKELTEALGNIAEFIFRILKTGITIINAIAKGISAIFPYFGDLGKVLIGIVTGFGKLAGKANAYLKTMKSTEDITRGVSLAMRVFGETLKFVGSTIKSIVTGNNLPKLSDDIKNTFSGDSLKNSDRLKPLTNVIKEFLNFLGKIKDTGLSKLKDIFHTIAESNPIAEVATKAIGKIKSIFLKLDEIDVGGIINKITDKLILLIQNLFTLNNALVLLIVSIASTVHSVAKLGASFGELVGGIGSFFRSFGSMLKDFGKAVKETAEGFSSFLKAKGAAAVIDSIANFILKLAIAFSLLVLAMGSSDKDYEKFKTASQIITRSLVFAIGILAFLLLYSQKVLNIASIKQLAKKIAIFSSISRSISTLLSSVSMLLLSTALTFAIVGGAFKSVPISKIILAISAIVIVLYSVTKMIQQLEKIKPNNAVKAESLIKTIRKLLFTTSISLAIIATAFRNVSYGKIISSIAAIGIVLKVCASFVEQVGKVSNKTIQKSVKVIKSIRSLLLTTAIALSIVALTFKNVSYGKILAAVTSISFLLLAATDMVEKISKINANSLNKSIFIIAKIKSLLFTTAISLALVALIFKNVSYGKILASVASVSFVLLVVADMVRKISKIDQAGVVNSILLISKIKSLLFTTAISLALIASVFKNISYGKIVSSILSIVVVLSVVTSMIKVLSAVRIDKVLSIKTMMSAIGSMMITLAITMFIISKALKNANVSEIAKAMGVAVIAMTLMLTVVTIFGAIISKSPTLMIGIMTISSLLTTLSVFAAVISVSAYVFAAALKLIIDIFTQFEGVLDTLPAQIAEFLSQLSVAIPSITNSLVIIGSVLAKGFAEFLLNVVKVLDDYSAPIIDKLLSFIFKLINILLNTLTTELPTLITNILNLLYALFNVLGTHMQEFLDKTLNFVFDLLEALGQAIEDNAPRLRDTIIKVLSNILNSIFILFGIDPNGKEAKFVKNIFKGIANGITEGIKLLLNFGDKLFDVGKNLIQGLIDGFNFLANTKVGKIVTDVGKKILGTFKNVLGIHSPSTETAEIAENTVLGFTNMLDKKIPVIDKSVKELATTAIDVLKEKFSGTKAGEIVSTFTSTIKDSIDDSLSKSVTSNGLGLDIDSAIKDPTITPQVDLSNVEAASLTASDILNSNATIDAGGQNGRLFDQNRAAAARAATEARNNEKYDDSNMLAYVGLLNARLQEVATRLANTQVVLDNGVLVGEMTAPLDSAFGTRLSRNVREKG